jgi:hypothetical protein
MQTHPGNQCPRKLTIIRYEPIEASHFDDGLVTLVTRKTKKTLSRSHTETGEGSFLYRVLAPRLGMSCRSRTT